MASSTKQTVTVRLEVFNEDESGESNAYRYLTLEAPSYSVRIGRGSRSGSKDLYPAENNAWFDSRVMSREHAILKANLVAKTLTIEDVGSMHGTYLPAEDLKLSKSQSRAILDGDAIVFGAEVSRGPDTFPALEIDVFYNFDFPEDDEENMSRPMSPMINHSADINPNARPDMSHNSFSVPDYDDYDSEENDDSETEAKVIAPPPLAAAIPESIKSTGGSFGSDNDEAPYEPWNRSYCNTFDSQGTTGGLKDTHKVIEEASATARTAPADLIRWLARGDSLAGDSLPNTFGASKKPTPIKTATRSNPVSPAQLPSLKTVMATQSKTLPVPTTVNTSGNLTEEQSESDYGDDISADLFDQDFEIYQSSKPQLDTSSFSSQSPVLTSLPSKIELAARQSTGKVDAKPTLPYSPLLGAAPIEQRAPSPSDAAMPKAKPTYPSFQYQSPAKATPSAQHSQYRFVSSSDLPAASHENSFMRTYGLGPSQVVSNVQDTYPLSYFSPDKYSQYDESEPADWNWDTFATKQPVTSIAKGQVSDIWAAATQAPASPFVTIKTTPRVSIKDLVDEPQIVECVNENHRGKAFAKSAPLPRKPENPTVPCTKRKADQISESENLPSISVSLAAVKDVMESPASQDHEDAQVIKKFSFATDSQSQTDLWGPVSMIETAISASLRDDDHRQTVEERPKKKARSDLYKYAAGAAGGIAIGAVGVVAALISLPQDYFV